MSGPSTESYLVDAEALKRVVSETFSRIGSDASESQKMAHYLVEANLAGHDSHGVIRVSYYVGYVQRGLVTPNRHAGVVAQTDSLISIDGGQGFGQVIGEESMGMAIRAAKRSGVCAMAIRNSGHLGRIGDWPLMATAAGCVSLHFVNTSGFGLLVAPFGGIDRRLSANPIAAGVPRRDGPPIILDISTASVAEGKLKVARNRGDRAPQGSIIDNQGRPTTDPNTFYADPPGAILPFGAHKGYGLGVIAELLAGAVAGSGCSREGVDRLINGMLTIVIDPSRLPREFGFDDEVENFVAFLKSSRRVDAERAILLPGEIEALNREKRLAEGIPLDGQTRAALLRTGEEVGVPCGTLALLG
ncbi:malate/lactate/ureidoglycolate dehydrogenase [Botrimarina sp.]|uniref:malate/lactate/ureidoglycolate dehydrogenase n=1 Tax=Botrimarina sp. TaxID=2795802 RepID=UPI0032EE039A